MGQFDKIFKNAEVSCRHRALPFLSLCRLVMAPTALPHSFYKTLLYKYPKLALDRFFTAVFYN